MADPRVRGSYYVVARDFHSTGRMQIVKPVLLADIGEGMVPQYAIRVLELNRHLRYCRMRNYTMVCRARS